MKERSNKRKLFFYSLSAVIILLVVFAIGEAGVRYLGYKSAHPSNRPDIKVEPGDSFYTRDSLLGYMHLQGNYKIIIKDTLVFNVSNTMYGKLRRTHPPEKDSLYKTKDKIWVMGGSCTYGWSISDEETYPWKLQELIKDYEVINFGVTGYGTIHSLLQMEKRLKTMEPPEMIVIGYADFHDDRNTYNDRRKKQAEVHDYLGPHIQPYARIGDDGELVIHRADTTDYQHWPLSGHSALINTTEKAFNLLKAKMLDNHEVSRRLIDRIHQICQRNGITLVIAGINPSDRTNEMLTYCRENDIPAVNIGVINPDGRYQNLPWDGHPNAWANTVYSYRLYEFIKDYL
ncbi:MAG: hypothetical protein K9I68_06920 [Bacteroidales bacterium]|nr:hypothetical protein [Bacteroidales bacterium]MCF8338296.1 hypothetical protein [Bacteroidales bacterium]